MNHTIIGRDAECLVLNQFLSSSSAEFLAIYGRRRVGKTYLVRQFFQDRDDLVFFNVTGMQEGRLAEQLANFTDEVGNTFIYPGTKLAVGKSWREAFRLLTDNMAKVAAGNKIVLFFDEFPWMATRNARVLQNLDYFWNQYWSRDDRVKLIICGSSASWIINNIINSKGGLHNRVTQNLFLQPLNLSQTKEFFKQHKINLTDKHLLEIYMVMGGVPFYLKKATQKKASATQIIENLAFKQRSFLLEEFDNLYAALFDSADIYIDIIKEVAAHRYGIGQEALFKKIGKSIQGSSGVKRMKDLVDTSFVMSFKPLYHKKRGIYYRVVDQYTLFYFYWIEAVKNTLLSKSLIKGYWDKIKSKPAWHAWAGLSFESICYDHLPQIVRALDLSPTAIPSTWRYSPLEKEVKGQDITQGAQIDLLFDRDDDAITICEIKYTSQPFVITKTYAEKLRQKVEVFKQVTKTKKQLFIAIISANGIKKNKYTDELISDVVTLGDLFTDV